MARAESQMVGSRLLGTADQPPKRLQSRVQLLLTSLLVGTNLIGLMVVVLLSTLVVPAPAATPATVTSLLIAIPAYAAFAVIVGVWWVTARSLRALRWVVHDDVPTLTDRRRTLRIPAQLTALQAALWIGGTVLFGVLASIVQPERAPVTGLIAGTATLVVCAIVFLLSEIAMRPIAARALAVGDPPESRLGVAARMLVFWFLGTGLPTLGLFFIAILSLTVADVEGMTLTISVFVLGTVVAAFGLFITWLNARAITAPIRTVREAVSRVQQGDLQVRIPVYDGTELGSLQVGFNDMVQGLRERERLRDMYGRQVGRDLAEAALANIELGGQAREVTVLFVDLTGSTHYAANRDPTDVVAVLNRFFGVVVQAVSARGGFVNKFMGDAVLAVFGAPVERIDHANLGLDSARLMAEMLPDEVPEVGFGIGVATGRVVAGYVGHETRFEYTVIGDTVNAASRIADLAKSTPAGVLADEVTVSSAGPAQEEWEVYGTTTLRGRPIQSRLFTLE